MTGAEMKAFDAAIELTVKFIEQGQLSAESPASRSDDSRATAMAGQVNRFFNLVHSNLKEQVK